MINIRFAVEESRQTVAQASRTLANLCISQPPQQRGGESQAAHIHDTGSGMARRASSDVHPPCRADLLSGSDRLRLCRPLLLLPHLPSPPQARGRSCLRCAKSSKHTTAKCWRQSGSSGLAALWTGCGRAWSEPGGDVGHVNLASKSREQSVGSCAAQARTAPQCWQKARSSEEKRDEMGGCFTCPSPIQAAS